VRIFKYSSTPDSRTHTERERERERERQRGATQTEALFASFSPLRAAQFPFPRSSNHARASRSSGREPSCARRRVYYGNRNALAERPQNRARRPETGRPEFVTRVRSNGTCLKFSKRRRRSATGYRQVHSGVPAARRTIPARINTESS
jgi:hypothetical protein